MKDKRWGRSNSEPEVLEKKKNQETNQCPAHTHKNPKQNKNKNTCQTRIINSAKQFFKREVA